MHRARGGRPHVLIGKAARLALAGPSNLQSGLDDPSKVPIAQRPPEFD
jgi:hypothetical protein